MQHIYVNKNSEINTISKAISLIESDATIHVAKGIYYEKIKLTKSNIIIIGEDKDNTIIYFDDYSRKKHKDGIMYNTFRTYTLMINANNITLKDITISNTSGYGPKIGQAVALTILGNNITLDNVNLKSYQDTLFIAPLPENLIERYKGFLPDDERIIPEKYVCHINNSYIEGSIDFIFGCGEAYFNNCEFKSILSNGFVFAPSTYQRNKIGFVVDNSRFTSLEGINSTYLARPWRDYGMVLIKNSTYDNHILDEGFNKWDNTERDKTCRFYEYNCRYLDNHSYKRIGFAKELTTKDLEDLN